MVHLIQTPLSTHRLYNETHARVREKTTEHLPGCAWWDTPGRNITAARAQLTAALCEAPYPPGIRGYKAIIAAVEVKAVEIRRWCEIIAGSLEGLLCTTVLASSSRELVGCLRALFAALAFLPLLNYADRSYVDAVTPLTQTTLTVQRVSAGPE